MNEKDLQLLFEKTFSSTSEDIKDVQPTSTQTLEETLDYVLGVIADITRLVSKDRECISNPRLLESYKDLMIYSAILNYIINSGKGETFEESIAKKILRKCQEVASIVESYIDTQ